MVYQKYSYHFFSHFRVFRAFRSFIYFLTTKCAKNAKRSDELVVHCKGVFLSENFVNLVDPAYSVNPCDEFSCASDLNRFR